MEVNQAPEPLGRRRSHRVPLHIGATVDAAGRQVPGQLVNLSRGGALFRFTQRRSVFPGPCTLQVALGSAPNRYISIPVEIVRAAGGQFGLEWRQPLPEEVGELGFLLKG
jgi:PilZ domain